MTCFFLHKVLLFRWMSCNLSEQVYRNYHDVSCVWTSKMTKTNSTQTYRTWNRRPRATGSKTKKEKKNKKGKERKEKRMKKIMYKKDAHIKHNKRHEMLNTHYGRLKWEMRDVHSFSRLHIITYDTKVNKFKIVSYYIGTHETGPG